MGWRIIGTNVKVTVTDDSDDISFRYVEFRRCPTASPAEQWQKPEPNYGPEKRERKDRNKHHRR